MGTVPETVGGSARHVNSSHSDIKETKYSKQEP